MATIKKLMTLLSQEGLSNDRAEVISTFTKGRTTSARQLTSEELDNLCKFFEETRVDSLDKKRKRVIAAIFGMYKKMNKTVSIEYVKGVACQAAKVEHFNDIPSARLESLYATFLHRQKDLGFSQRLVEGYINEQQCYN